MNLTEMKQWLTEHGVQLTKSLGQNFLHDQNQLRRIVAAAELTEGDKVPAGDRSRFGAIDGIVGRKRRRSPGHRNG